MSLFPRAGRILVTLMLPLLAACETLPELEDLLQTSSDSALSSDTIADGLREALIVGSQRAVDQLGTTDGFASSVFRIPLPEPLQQARSVASRFGMGGMFDELELKLNRAAEEAAPKAATLFAGAVRQMTFSDVMGIYNGPQDAATQYLRRTTQAQLSNQMRPIIDRSLASVGAIGAFEELAGRYNRLPLVDPIDADVGEHVLGYANDAIFKQLAQEEAAIRENPAQRTTALLRQVFSR